MAPDEQNQNSTPQEEVMPGLSNTSFESAPVENKNTPKPANANRKRTRLDEVINEAWGYGELDDDAFESIIKYADPDTADKNKTGFEVALRNGGKIKWNPQSQTEPEMISCPSRKFNPEAAAAMVALSRLHGWKALNVHGTVEQKEMLWLEVQRQNLLEKEAFERKVKDGTIPKDKDGKLPVYTPLTVANFTPLADSRIYQQWLQEEAAWKAQHPEEVAPVEVTKANDVAPEKKAEPAEEVKNETAPVADNKAVAKTEAKKVPDTKVKSKYLNTKNYKAPHGDKNDSKFFKSNGKPKHLHPNRKQRGGPKHSH